MQLKNMLRFKMAWARPTGPRSDIVLSSRLRLARNLCGTPFPDRAGEAALGLLRDAVLSAVDHCGSLRGAGRILLDEVGEVDRRFLVERRLISDRLASRPSGRGVVVGDEEILSVMINEEDHLRLQGIDSGLCLDRLLDAAERLDDQLCERLPVAFDRRWGFLTACPTNVGTGMRASCLVHLPGLALTGELDPMLEGLKACGMTARGIYGEGTKVMGDFYQISNSVSLGVSEAAISAAVSKKASNLVDKESRARSALSSGGRRLRLEDLVHRSIGILSRARSISYEETMQHLSYARMGLSLGWKGLQADLKTVNELLILTQPAHVQMLAGKELGPEDRDFLRATLLRRKFGGTED